MRHKILFISSWYPNRLEPTNGNFVQRHAEATALYQDVEVLHAIGDFGLKKRFEVTENVVNGIRTVIIYYKNSRNPLKNFLTRMKAYRFGFKKMAVPDLVHANVMHNNLLFAVYLKRKFGIPFVVSEHWTALQSDHHQKTFKKIKTIAKFIGNSADYILPVSINLEKSLKFLDIKTPMKVIGNVTDTSIFHAAHLPNKDTFQFLHISNLTKRKNPSEIINATIKLREKGINIRLEIGGDGDILPLRNLVKNHNAENFITIFGEISHEKVAEKMQNSDCFVLFSDYENLPCVLLESMSCGVPVIAANVGGTAEIVNKNCGILIEKNFSELVNAMENVATGNIQFDSPELLHNRVVENYSKQKIGEKFSEIYDNILQR